MSIRKTSTDRRGMRNLRAEREAEEAAKDQGMHLSMEINDSDIWVVDIGGKTVIGGFTSIGKLPRPIYGKVLMRFINKDGRRVEYFN